jgi:hypothetical protein
MHQPISCSKKHLPVDASLPYSAQKSIYTYMLFASTIRSSNPSRTTWSYRSSHTRLSGFHTPPARLTCSRTSRSNAATRRLTTLSCCFSLAGGEPVCLPDNQFSCFQSLLSLLIVPVTDTHQLVSILFMKLFSTTISRKQGSSCTHLLSSGYSRSAGLYTPLPPRFNTWV